MKLDPVMQKAVEMQLNQAEAEIEALRHLMGRIHIPGLSRSLGLSREFCYKFRDGRIKSPSYTNVMAIKEYMRMLGYEVACGKAKRQEEL